MTYRGSFAIYAGQLAYLDTFSGLVPVKVLTVADDGAVTVRVTAARRGYARGETIPGQLAGRHVIPRTAVYVSGGQYRIAGAPVRAIPDSECGKTGAGVRYNVTRDTDTGEISSFVPGWIVTYPATCNGALGDLGFVASRGRGGSGFVHFDYRTGEPYGMPLTVAARDRLRAMRRDFRGELARTDGGA